MNVRTVQLGDVCEVVMGQSPPSSTYNAAGDGLPFFQGKADFGEIFPNTRVYCSQPARVAELGDILISVRAPVGPTNLARQRCCIGRGLSALRPSKHIDTAFLFYFLRFYEPQLAKLGLGATFAAINRDDLEDTNILLPDLAEQKRIARLLEQADQLRRTRRYALELSDTFLPAAFLELFGDPASNPHGFPSVQLEELFAKGRDGTKCGPFGSALKKHEYQSHGIPVWTMDNFSGGDFREEGCLYVSEKKYRELAAYSVTDGDVLISRAGTVGRMAIVKTRYEHSIIHTNLIRLSLNTTRILPSYFLRLMKSFGPSIARLKRGQEGAYTFMSTGSLGELRIPLPPMTLQERFSEVLMRHKRLRDTQCETLRQADHFFQSLLHRAFGSN